MSHCPRCGYVMFKRMCMSPTCNYILDESEVALPRSNIHNDQQCFKSVVLLSGGMDSATALYWANEHTLIRSVVFCDYGQKGGRRELQQAADLVWGLGFDANEIMQIARISLPPAVHSTILSSSDRYDLIRRDMPNSTVPTRNLTLISLAGAVAFELGANLIVGGWNQVDVDYPDCRESFLNVAGEAVNESLGLGYNDIRVHSPVLFFDKTSIVQMGEELHVPWEHTRSCYESHILPCLSCDSCKKRVIAFLKAGVRDPVVGPDTWDKLSQRWDELLASDKTFTEEELWAVLT